MWFSGAFEDPEITHIDDTVDPVRDLETIGEELRLKVCRISVDLHINFTEFVGALNNVLLHFICRM
jgi:hypothetical protein